MRAGRFGQYPPEMMEHFMAPRNVGELPVPPARHARGENAECGDRLDLYLLLRDGVVEDARFRVAGCTAAIAACSALTELLKSRSLQSAAVLDVAALNEALGGLPPVKRHALDLAIETLRAALNGSRS
jgi:nitrogen fixation NifU-like protein